MICQNKTFICCWLICNIFMTLHSLSKQLNLHNYNHQVSYITGKFFNDIIRITILITTYKMPFQMTVQRI